jgi:hypothetical protein
MYPESQDATEEMKPALLEMAAVFEAIICPYASKLVKSMDFVNKFFFGAKFDYFYILLVFLCNFLIICFIHLSGFLPNPPNILPPLIGLANNMNTEKRFINDYSFNNLKKILKHCPS